MHKRIIIFLALLFLPFCAYGNQVTGFRANDKATETRFVLDFTEKPKYTIFTLNNPMRVVIDVEDSGWDKDLPPHDEVGRIKSVRYFISEHRTLRVVLDAAQDVKVKKQFILDKRGTTPYRLVLDIESTGKDQVAAIPEPTAKDGTELAAPVPTLKIRRKPLIVIDAGHGGHDPGTISNNGTQEKDLTLEYAKELQHELIDEDKYEVFMTRKRDVYIPLKDRVERARNAKGDLFISIHVNSHPNKDTNGLCVYTLSETASDKEAELLAKKENKEGLINGLNLANKENEITELFIDMAQRDTKNLSASFAENIVTQAKEDTQLLQKPHRFAGFRVLTGADIPSVLVELGYITNEKEELLLRTESYKNKLAKAIVRAIDNHFGTYQIE
ncbi:MAG: N-acetylmuramoyl-L-alanine amidase [Rickettsiaceae bacterium]|jgi:N-acetylmuramoyl-L-alanine amidase|nr:N-acetylmuramoyl-L-alanine amidase [Rickettsiaceae bacterium]